MKAILATFLLLLLCAPVWAQTSPQGRVFRVTDFGARPDDSTDDWTAFQKALAAASVSGGTVKVPDGVFQLDAGVVGTDTRWSTTGGTVHRMLLLNADNITLELSPKTEIRVTAASICQTNSGSLAPCTQMLFGTDLTTLSNWRIIGNGGKFTFNRAGSASLYTVLNGANAFKFCQLDQTYKPYWENFTLLDFPQGGLIGGTADSAGQLRTYGTYNNIHAIDYGASGHDNLFYWHGNNAFNDWIVTNSRQFHSHVWYFGSGRPDNNINHAWVIWTNGDAGIANKYILQHYSETGLYDLSDVTIQNSHFEVNGILNAMLFQHLNNASLFAARIKLINNTFIGGGGASGVAITMQNPLDSEISGNRFSGWGTMAISATVHPSSGTGRNLTVARNYISACGSGAALAAGITDSLIDNNEVTAPVGSPIHITSLGARNNIRGNKITNAGVGGAIAMSLAGDNFQASDNVIFSDNSNNYSELVDVSGGDGWTFSGNRINTTQTSLCIFSGSNFKITNNTTNQRMIVAAGVTGNNLYSGNVHVGSVGKPNLRGNATFSNNIAPNGLFADSGSEAAGFLNGTGNTLSSSGLVDTLVNTSVSGTLSLHTGIYRNFYLTATGNISSLGTPVNPTDGRPIVVAIKQDSVGGRSIAVGSSFTSSCSPTTTANTTTIYNFIYSTVAGKFLEVSPCRTGQ